jgi:excisionase family DNA binding protein
LPHLGADRDLAIDQVADRLHASPATVRAWIRSGLLEARHHARLYRIPTAALADFERPPRAWLRPRNRLGQFLPDK